MADNKAPELSRIEIDGHWGTLAYLDDKFELTDLEHAVLAKVVFDDGGNIFYTVDEASTPVNG